MLRPPELDVAGYQACVAQCRERFTGLRVLSGVELSEPHWYPDRASELLARGGFDRVLASVHSAAGDGGFVEVGDRYRQRPAVEVMREYLREVLLMVQRFDRFEVLAHIDYPVRCRPAAEGPYRPQAYEEEYRAILRHLAGTGQVLEINTKAMVTPEVLRWWRQEGGRAVSFASDAHQPSHLARQFRAAVQMAHRCGFGPGRDPFDYWLRR